MPTAASLVPAIRYRDLTGAVDWLCETYGFAKQHVVADEGGRMLFAQLKFGRSSIMLGPVGNSDIDGFLRQPDEVGNVETQSCYLVVDDIDEHRRRSEAAGAEIIIDVRAFDYGGRGYSCRDPEGHIWNFGTYDPSANTIEPKPRPLRRWLVPVSLLVALVGVTATLAIERTFFGTSDIAAPPSKSKDTLAALPPRTPVSDAQIVSEQAPPTLTGGPKEVKSRYAAASAAARLDQRRRTTAARAAARRVRVQLVRLEQQKARADQARQLAEENLRREQSARKHSEEIARGIKQQLSTERAAKEKAERSLQELHEKLQQSQQAVPPPVAKGSKQAKSSPTKPPQKQAPKNAAAKSSEEAADTMPALIP